MRMTRGVILAPIAAARFLRAAVDAVALMTRDCAVVNAALAKRFNMTDVATQVRAMIVYDAPALRQRRADEFCDASIIEADRKGLFRGAPGLVSPCLSFSIC